MAEVRLWNRRAIAPLLVLAALGLLVLLSFNLRNLNPGEEQLPPTIGTQNPPASEAAQGAIPLRTLYLAFLVVTVSFVIAGIVLMIWRREKLGSLFTVWDLIGYAMGVSFIILVVKYFTELSNGIENLVRPPPTGTNVTTPGTTGVGSALGTAPAGSAVVLVAAVAVGGCILVLGVIFLTRLYGVLAESPPTASKNRRLFAASVGRAIADLEAGDDFRGAVLRCYQSMLILFEGRGLRAAPSLTAREVEADALRALGVSRQGIEDLTSLFEEARYSVHPIGAVQRDAAIACLSSIRSQMEARA